MTSKRDINATNETALLQRVVRPITFARLDFSSGAERYHTDIGPRNATHPIHGSEVYTGIGDFGGIEGDVVETIKSVAETVNLTITGVDATKVNLAITDNFFMRDVEIMFGLLDESGDLVANPEVLFSGFMGKADIALEAGLGQIMLTCESRGVKLNRPSDWRFTDEDKQIEVNGDLMGEYIYRMVDLQLLWGQHEVGGGGPRRHTPSNPRHRQN